MIEINLSKIRGVSSVCIVFVAISIQSVIFANEEKAAIWGSLGVECDELMSDALSKAGYELIQTNKKYPLIDQISLLVICNGQDMWCDSIESVSRFIHNGGDIIVLRAPLWKKYYLQTLDKTIKTIDIPASSRKTLIEFDSGDLRKWERSSNNLNTNAEYEIIPRQPTEDSNALHVTMTEFTAFESFNSPLIKEAFAKNHTLTILWAKGGHRTIELLVEWTENNGSRWIATIPLEQKWQQYVLRPNDFKFWVAGPPREAQRFRPSEASRLSFGLAFTHTTSFGGGRHEYWVGPISTAEDANENNHPIPVPVIDTLSPCYKFFKSHEVDKLKVYANQTVVSDKDFSVPAGEILCPHVRPTGAGFNKNRLWRWIPLLEVENSCGVWRGNPAAIMINVNGKFKSSIWVSFGISEKNWYCNPKVVDTIGEIATYIKRKCFIVDGGANHYTYFEDQPVNYGLSIANLGNSNTNDLRVKLAIANARNRNKIKVKEWPVGVMAEQEKSFSSHLNTVNWPVGGLSVTAELFDGDDVIDMVSHKIYVWKSAKDKHFVTVKNGEFYLDNKIWKPYGVNYLPSSGAAALYDGTRKDWFYFERWLSKESYDTEIVERDISNIKNMGFNAISVYLYHGNLKAQNLLDVLRLAETYNLKVNFCVRPFDPMVLEWDKFHEIVNYYKIRDQDCIFAFDIAYEPRWPSHTGRQKWDREWQEWVMERYGSVQNAEADWGVPIPRTAESNITNPSDYQFIESGPWYKMIAAYRRFLDTLLYQKYSAATRLIKDAAPKQLVSFRMSEAGNPTYSTTQIIPYDFPYLSAAVDFLAPEAYGRIGGWQEIKPGWFERKYAKWAAPHKPMIWAEAGTSVWVRSRMTTLASQLQFQADYYENFIKMMLESGANGIFFWYYPGGYRIDENSDYGIINPDGSNRPVSKIIRENASLFLSTSSFPDENNYQVEIDRDAHCEGIAGIYNAVKECFWEKIESGYNVGLRSLGTDTNSANCPLMAVGNTLYNGNNPLKYLDGFFDIVSIRNSDGDWVSISKGDTIEVNPKQPVYAKLKVTNLGESSWLSPLNRNSGGVYILLKSNNKVKQIPLPHSVTHLSSVTMEDIVLLERVPNEETEICLTFLAKNRATFGPKYNFKIVSTPLISEVSCHSLNVLAGILP